jgi:hypothetical protein
MAVPSVWFFSSSVSTDFPHVFSSVAYARLSGIGSMVVPANATVNEMDRRNGRVGLRIVTVLQLFPFNELFAPWTQVFIAVSTVDLLEIFRVSKVLQVFPNEVL